MRARLQTTIATIIGIGSIATAGCGLDTEVPAEEAAPTSATNAGAIPMTIRLTSTAFTDGAPIPKKHTGDGQDVSPPLSWSGLPAETRQLALICDDPDAPVAEPWVHWVIYKIRADAGGLPEGVPHDAQLVQPPGALQGKNSWPRGQTIGYRGPAPPKGHGTHHYHFKLYSLDKELSLNAGATKKELLSAMQGHVLAEGELMGTYER